MDRLRWMSKDDMDYYQEPVSAVRKRARRLLDGLDGLLSDKPVDKTQANRVAKLINAVVSSKATARKLRAAASVIYGCRLVGADRVTFACSVAGSVAAAKRYSTVEIVANDVAPVDAFVYVKRCETKESPMGVVVVLELTVCNSVLAGGKVLVELSLDRARQWARMLDLLGTRRNHYRWYSYKQLLGAAMIARVGKTAGQLYVQGAGTNAITSSENKKLSASRSRSKSPCPYGSEYDCGECGVGQNQCDRSCSTEITEFPLQRL